MGSLMGVDGFFRRFFWRYYIYEGEVFQNREGKYVFI